MRQEFEIKIDKAASPAKPELMPLGRREIWRTGLAVTLAGIAGPAAALGKSRADEAMATTQLACDAFKNSDIPAIERLLRPDFTQINSSGTVQQLPELLEEVRGGGIAYDEFRNHSMSAKFVNGVAIVVGITSLRGRSAGEPFALDVRFTDILERNDGYWRMITSHVTRLTASDALDKRQQKG